MKVEALASMTIRMSTGDLSVTPRQIVDLPGVTARRLLRQAAGKVRIPLDEFQIGRRVWWDSPLFGETAGTIAMPPCGGFVVVADHEVTGGTVPTSLSWVIEVGHDTVRPADSATRETRS